MIRALALIGSMLVSMSPLIDVSSAAVVASDLTSGHGYYCPHPADKSLSSWTCFFPGAANVTSDSPAFEGVRTNHFDLSYLGNGDSFASILYSCPVGYTPTAATFTNFSEYRAFWVSHQAVTVLDAHSTSEMTGQQYTVQSIGDFNRYVLSNSQDGGTVDLESFGCQRPDSDGPQGFATSTLSLRSRNQGSSLYEYACPKPTRRLKEWRCYHTESSRTDASSSPAYRSSGDDILFDSSKDVSVATLAYSCPKGFHVSAARVRGADAIDILSTEDSITCGDVSRYGNVGAQTCVHASAPGIMMSTRPAESTTVDYIQCTTDGSSRRQRQATAAVPDVRPLKRNLRGAE